MKTRILAILFTIALLFTLVSCAVEKETPKEPLTLSGTEIPAEGLWKKATYLEDQTLGTGSKSITVKVIAEDRYVTFTLKTDKDNLGEALVESKLVEGEDGPYGLYIKKVNGILADYDVDQSYWSFEIGGEAQMNGVSDVTVKGGESFELRYAK